MLSNSFSRVISHAREEYLYVYSVYVLEASTSNRLTHFYPPFNLIALLIFRPLRLFFPSNNTIRAGRIFLLKATHLPIVGAIMLYEAVRGKVGRDDFGGFKGPLVYPPPPSYHSTSNDNSNNGATTTQGPRRKVSRARMSMRPASSSSQGQQQRRAAGGRMSVSGFEPLQATRVASIRPFAAGAASSSSSAVAAAAATDASVDDVDAPTQVEVKIAELSAKVERLTEIILAMQSDRQGGSGADTSA